MNKTGVPPLKNEAKINLLRYDEKVKKIENKTYSYEPVPKNILENSFKYF
jgi:hypothetical protein